MSVAELLCSCDSRELTELTAISRLDPWGERQMDWRFAVLCQVVQNAGCSKKDQCKTAEEFLDALHPTPPDTEPDEQQRDPRDVTLESMLLRITGQLGGAVVNNQ